MGLQASEFNYLPILVVLIYTRRLSANWEGHTFIFLISSSDGALDKDNGDLAFGFLECDTQEKFLSSQLLYALPRKDTYKTR